MRHRQKGRDPTLQKSHPSTLYTRDGGRDGIGWDEAIGNE